MKKVVLLVLQIWAVPAIAQWTQIANVGKVNAIAIQNNVILAGLDTGLIVSKDGVKIEGGGTGLRNLPVTSLAISGTTIFAGTLGAGIYKSNLTTLNWTRVDSANSMLRYVHGLIAINNSIYAA